MGLAKLSPYLEGVGYFLIALVLAAWGTQANFVWWHLPLLESAQFHAQYGDPISFATAAEEIARIGWVSEANRWIINLWPPGFILLEAAVLKLLGGDAPVVAVFFCLSAGIFSWLLVALRRHLSRAIAGAAWLFPISFFILPLTSVFIFQPIGLLFGEWLSVACMFASVLCFLKPQRYSVYMAAGLLATAAYMRPQYEIIADGMLIYALGTWLFMHIAKLSASLHFSIVKKLLGALLLAQVLMLPWRVYHQVVDQRIAWTLTDSWRIANSLLTDEALIARGAGFALQGGINVACHVEPSACGGTDKATFMRIFVQHPVAWLAEKCTFLPRYWFAPVTQFTTPRHPPSGLDYFYNTLLLGLLISIVGLNWAVRKMELVAVFTCFNFGTAMMYGLLIAFAHFEVRYFFYLKLYALVMSFLLFAYWRKNFNLNRLKICEIKK